MPHRRRPTYVGAEIVSLLVALDIEIVERAGSRVLVRKYAERVVLHRPHPQPHLIRPAVRDLRNFLTDLGSYTVMEYKGYIAEVEFDDLEKVFCGHVINSGPYSIVTFVSEDEGQLYKEFCLSVDIYLESCLEDGVEPKKPMVINS